MSDTTRGTLALTEPHPMARDALQYVQSIPLTGLMQCRDAMASCAIEGNRSAEICGETLGRLIEGLPVSDRYIMGLAWMLRNMEDGETSDPNKD